MFLTGVVAPDSIKLGETSLAIHGWWFAASR